MRAMPEESGELERFHPRVDANFMVQLISRGRTVIAKARDLSMAGLWLIGDPDLPMEGLQISIPLPDDREILTGCSVKRRTDDGIALQFDQLDWEDLFALARYLHPRLP